MGYTWRTILITPQVRGLGGSVVKDIHGLPFHGSPGRSLIRRDDTASAPSFISHENPSASSGVRSAMNCGERIFAAIFARIERESHGDLADPDRKSTRLNSSHRTISYAV